MVILMILFGIFFAAGLFLILADVFRIPTMQTVKVMSTAGRSEKSRENSGYVDYGRCCGIIKTFANEPA